MNNKEITIQDILKNEGIRPLDKRIMIYEYLVKRKNHPTVDIIYNDLKSVSPSLSKTTVYNTINLLLEKRLVQALNIEGNELRYDADTSFHGHFKCIKCGEVFDFVLENKQLPSLPLDGFTTHRAQYHIEGICRECNAITQN